MDFKAIGEYLGELATIVIVVGGFFLAMYVINRILEWINGL